MAHTMTIEELATQVGMTVRNVRAYNSAGLLPPPTLRGRLGLYGEEHLAQLQVIRTLRNQGLSLERIKAVVEQNSQPREAWNKLGELARALSLHIPASEAPAHMPLSAIEATWRADFTPAQTEQLVRSGLQRMLPDGSIEYLTPALRAVAQELADLGVPVDNALGMQEAISRDLRRMVRGILRAMLQNVAHRQDDAQGSQRLLERTPLLLQEAVLAMMPAILQQEATQLARNLPGSAATSAAADPAPGIAAQDGRGNGD